MLTKGNLTIGKINLIKYSVLQASLQPIGAWCALRRYPVYQLLLRD